DGSSVDASPDVKKDRRGKVIRRRVKPQAKSDCNTDPTVLPYFFYQIRERTAGKFPVFMDNGGIELLGNEIFDHPIIYFTSHYAINITPAEAENVKKYLTRGGTRLLDDCAGSWPFIDSVPTTVQRLIDVAEMKLLLKEPTAF